MRAAAENGGAAPVVDDNTRMGLSRKEIKNGSYLACSDEDLASKYRVNNELREVELKKSMADMSPDFVNAAREALGLPVWQSE